MNFYIIIVTRNCHLVFTSELNTMPLLNNSSSNSASESGYDSYCDHNSKVKYVTRASYTKKPYTFIARNGSNGSVVFTQKQQ